MRKLDLANYTFHMPDARGVLQFITYDSHKSLEVILTSQVLGLNGPELMRAMELVEKVRKAGNEILLDDDDYELIIAHCKRFKGFTNNDHKFLKRIYDCPVVSDDKIAKFSDDGKEKK